MHAISLLISYRSFVTFSLFIWNLENPCITVILNIFSNKFNGNTEVTETSQASVSLFGQGSSLGTMDKFWKSHTNSKSYLTFLCVLSFEGESWQSLKALSALHLLKRIFQSAVFLRKDQATTFNRSLGRLFGPFWQPVLYFQLSDASLMFCVVLMADCWFNRWKYEKFLLHEAGGMSLRLTALKTNTKTLNWHRLEAKRGTITWGYCSYCDLNHGKGSASTSQLDSNTSSLFQVFHRNTSNAGIWDTLD